MRATRLLAAALLLAPAAARAAEPPKAQAVAHWIDISTVALPIVWQGRVVNYVFTGVRVNLVPSADAIRLRTEKEPYLRDALVRAGHRTPFVIPWDFTHLDQRALVAAMTPQAEAVLGRGQVVSVVVTEATPKQRSGLPERPKPGRPEPPPPV